MIRFADVGDPEVYFTQHLDKGDYFLEGQESGGVWRGKGAARLGLEGDIDTADFAKLCQNRKPGTNEKLTPRDAKNRRPGVDLSFHCPKSVSLLYGLSGDEEIKEAVQSAVRKTMQELERDTQVRVRRGKEKNTDEDRTTGNLAWGEFVHKTARPVKGIPDPHLHVHCYIFNASYDQKEDRFKAAQLGKIRRDSRYYEACFHSHLADNLARQGYEIEASKRGWEIAGIKRETLEKFSARSKEIEDKAKEKEAKLGRKLSAKERDGLAAQTRSKKAKDIPYADLQAEWAQRLNVLEQEAILTAYTERDSSRYQEQGQAREASGDQAMEHALSHCLERKSVVREKELLATAIKHSLGRSTVGDIKRSLDLQEDVLRGREKSGQMMVSTVAVKREEQEMVGFAEKSKGSCQALNDEAAEYEFKYDFLNAQQRAAVHHVMTSQDRVMMIQGKAGVGKTTTVAEAARAIDQGGHQVYTFAPTSEAAKVLQEDGFEANTVSHLLVNTKLQEQLQGQVIWIDEAGLVSSKMMNQVFRVAKAQDARVVLSGDTRQHHSVERGDAMRQLADQAGLPIADIEKIQRQKGRYKEAVEYSSQGKTAKSFEVLESLEWIEEVKKESEREEKLAEAYVKTVTSGQTALVVSPTHREKDRVTKKIREGLREKGHLKGEDAMAYRQVNLNWTEAERKDSRNYEKDLVLQMTQNAQGLKRGERLTLVEGETPEELMAERHDGERIALPLDHAKRFQVYRKKDMDLTQGDRLTITQNGFCKDKDGNRKRLVNGMSYGVKGVAEDGKVHLDNGWILDQDFGHIDHGYCTTSHKAQGKTVDHVFLAQSADSNPAASREQFYVSISRGRKSVTIYTDDKKELKKAVYRSDERLTVHELESQAKGYEKRKATQERRDAFADNTRAATEARSAQEGPLPYPALENEEAATQEASEPPERRDWDKVLEDQKQDLTEAERLTRDDVGKSQDLPQSGNTPSRQTKRKNRRISANTLHGLIHSLGTSGEAERQNSNFNSKQNNDMDDVRLHRLIDQHEDELIRSPKYFFDFDRDALRGEYGDLPEKHPHKDREWKPSEIEYILLDDEEQGAWIMQNVPGLEMPYFYLISQDENEVVAKLEPVTVGRSQYDEFTVSYRRSSREPELTERYGEWHELSEDSLKHLGPVPIGNEKGAWYEEIYIGRKIEAGESTYPFTPDAVKEAMIEAAEQVDPYLQEREMGLMIQANAERAKRLMEEHEREDRDQGY